MRCLAGFQPARRVDGANRDLADYIDMSLTEAMDEADCGMPTADLADDLL
jgi:hypothetical protein